ncbi:MAG: hypothetical protein QF672_15325, partial [SAR202 cluster bacterium]|nr:hypothetical protein [SAR202 cluster bacterium]
MYHEGGSSAEMWRLKTVPPVAFNQERQNLIEGGLESLSVRGGIMNDRDVLYPYLDTPAVLMDMDRLEANIAEMAQAAAEAGVELRPHVKIHQCPAIAKMQIEAGACGVEVGNV